MWVDQVGALISGREFMGFGELLRNFGSETAEDRISVACWEYDTVLIDGEASDLIDVCDDGLQCINRGGANMSTFGRNTSLDPAAARQSALLEGKSMSAIARTFKVHLATVYRCIS